MATISDQSRLKNSISTIQDEIRILIDQREWAIEEYCEFANKYGSIADPQALKVSEKIITVNLPHEGTRTMTGDDLYSWISGHSSPLVEDQINALRKRLKRKEQALADLLAEQPAPAPEQPAPAPEQPAPAPEAKQPAPEAEQPAPAPKQPAPAPEAEQPAPAPEQPAPAPEQPAPAPAPKQPAPEADRQSRMQEAESSFGIPVGYTPEHGFYRRGKGRQRLWLPKRVQSFLANPKELSPQQEEQQNEENEQQKEEKERQQMIDQARQVIGGINPKHGVMSRSWLRKQLGLGTGKDERKRLQGVIDELVSENTLGPESPTGGTYDLPNQQASTPSEDDTENEGDPILNVFGALMGKRGRHYQSTGQLFTWLKSDQARKATQMFSGPMSKISPGLDARVQGLPDQIAGMGGKQLASTVAGYAFAAYNVQESYDVGKRLVDSILKGAGSLGREATGAGMRISKTLLKAVTQPFGPGGQAIVELGLTVTKAIGGLMGSVMGLVGNVVGAGMRMAGGLVGGGVGLAGAIIGAVVAGPVGAAVGSLLGVFAMKGIAAIADLVGGVLGVLGKAFGEFGEVVSQAISTIKTVIEDATQSAMQYSSAVLGIAAHTGMSLASANNVTRTLGSLGVAPQQAASMFQGMSQMSPFLAARGTAWGIQGVGAGGEMNMEAMILSMQSQFQKMGPVIGRVMLQSMGMEQLLPQMMMSPQALQKQFQFSRDLGMDPDAVMKWQQDFALARTSFGQFVEYLKMTFGTELLPLLQERLDAVVSYFKNHREQIVTALRDLANGFYTTFRAIADTARAVWRSFTSGGQQGQGQGAAKESAIQRASRWIYIEAPRLIVGGLHSIMQNVASVARFFQTIGNALRGFARSFTPLFFGFELGRVILSRVAHGFMALYHVFQMLTAPVNALASALGHLIAAVLNPFNAKAQLAAAKSALTGIGQQGGQHWDAFKEESAKAVTPFGKDDFGMSKWGWSKGSDFADKAQSWADKMGTAQGELDPSKRNEKFDQMLAHLRDIKDNTEKGLDVNVKSDIHISPMDDFFAKVAAYEALATWRAASRAV